MKQNLIFILIILLGACSSNSKQKESETEKVIDILDEQDYLKRKLEIHKEKEVRIYGSTYRMPGSEFPNYGFNVYRKGIGPSRYLIFWGHNKYDKAAYKWINDTTLNIRLFNSSNNLSDNYTYKIHGKYSESLGINTD
jgi:hypothetical protein